MKVVLAELHDDKVVRTETDVPEWLPEWLPESGPFADRVKRAPDVLRTSVPEEQRCQNTDGLRIEFR